MSGVFFFEDAAQQPREFQEGTTAPPIVAFSGACGTFKSSWKRQQGFCACRGPGPCESGQVTWKIIPISKWLITMVIVSPLSRVVPLPNGFFMAYKSG